MTRAETKKGKQNNGLWGGARLAVVCSFLISIFYCLPAGAQTPEPALSAAEAQPVVESYYKIAPGKTDEWLELYRTHHLPILREMQREGRILSITIYKPFLHQGGPPWDFKVILRFRDFTAFGDRAHEEAIARRLYADWEDHQRSEQRRWTVTDHHWDDIMSEVPAE